MSLETLSIFSPLMILTAGFVFIGLERLFPYNPGQRVLRDEFWTDLIGYGIIQSYLMGLIISQLIYFIDNSTQMSRLQIVTHWPIWLQVLLFIVWHDFNTYCIHLLQHRSKILWRTHEAHHACRNVDFLSGIRSHSLEILMYQTVEFLPVILLGAAPEVPLYKAMANSIYGMYIHSNLRVHMGKLLYVLNGPELHRWHHANDDQRAYGKNLATKFTLWDRLFGTYFNPEDRLAQEYGPDDPQFPRGYVRQHLFAFRSFPQK